MANYFNPEDVIIKDGVVSNITRNGAGFISTKDGEDIFVPIRLVQTSGIDMGDSVSVYVIKNFGDASLKNINDSAPFRALRVVINNRLGVAATQELAATVDLPTYSTLPVLCEPDVSSAIKVKLGTASLRPMTERYFVSGFIGTASMMHSRLVKDYPEIDMIGDDNGVRVRMDISSVLNHMHEEGLIAKARICATGDQKNSSYSVYGSTAKGLFNAIIGA